MSEETEKKESEDKDEQNFGDNKPELSLLAITYPERKLHKWEQLDWTLVLHCVQQKIFIRLPFTQWQSDKIQFRHKDINMFLMEWFKDQQIFYNRNMTCQFNKWLKMVSQHNLIPEKTLNTWMDWLGEFLCFNCEGVNFENIQDIVNMFQDNKQVEEPSKKLDTKQIKTTIKQLKKFQGRNFGGLNTDYETWKIDQGFSQIKQDQKFILEALNLALDKQIFKLPQVEFDSRNKLQYLCDQRISYKHKIPLVHFNKELNVNAHQNIKETQILLNTQFYHLEIHENNLFRFMMDNKGNQDFSKFGKQKQIKNLDRTHRYLDQLFT